MLVLVNVKYGKRVRTGRKFKDGIRDEAWVVGPEWRMNGGHKLHPLLGNKTKILRKHWNVTTLMSKMPHQNFLCTLEITIMFWSHQGNSSLPFLYYVPLIPHFPRPQSPLAWQRPQRWDLLSSPLNLLGECAPMGPNWIWCFLILIFYIILVKFSQT